MKVTVKFGKLVAELGLLSGIIGGIWYLGYHLGFEEAKTKASNLLMQEWIKAQPEGKDETEKDEEGA